ncbi:MAG: hypothetical protein WKF96_25115 [Solirubrobacteraceae bacterium]
MTNDQHQSAEVVSDIRNAEKAEVPVHGGRAELSDGIRSLPYVGPAIDVAHRLCDPLRIQQTDSSGVRAVKQTARTSVAVGTVLAGTGLSVGVGLAIVQ